MRMDDDFFEARRIRQRVNAGGVTVDPGNDRTERVVVVGVHGGIANVSIPALPPSSCAFREHVTPGWVGIVQQETISHIGASMIGKREKQERRAEESG